MMQNWHRRMTLERRCHWCGKPSSPDFANACEEHKAKARRISRESKARIRKARKAIGVCILCGKPKNGNKMLMCEPCRLKVRKWEREYKEHNTLQKFDGYIDKGLISTAEAAIILGVSLRTVHRLVKRNKLQVRGKLRKGFWFSEKEIRKHKNNGQ